jgi:hypothetical protein
VALSVVKKKTLGVVFFATKRRKKGRKKNKCFGPFKDPRRSKKNPLSFLSPKKNKTL